MSSTKQIFDYFYQLEDEVCLTFIGTCDHAPDQVAGDVYLESKRLERWKSPLCADKIHPFHNHPTHTVQCVHIQHLVSVTDLPRTISKGSFAVNVGPHVSDFPLDTKRVTNNTMLVLDL
jgi:hypothetical protein